MTDSATVSFLQLALAFCLALASSLALTPLVRSLAIRLGFVDRPDGDRKTHSTPVALGGGAAVLGAVLLALSILAIFSVALDYPLLPTRFMEIGDASDGPAVESVEGSAQTAELASGDGTTVEGEAEDDAALPPSRAKAGQFWGGLLVAAIMIVILGLIDDVFGLRGSYKLLGQILIVCILIAAGVRIDRIGLLSQTSDALALGMVAVPLTMIWLLGAINAINLLDGVDGLASTLGLVICVTIAGLTFYQGEVVMPIVMLALAGALLGFLVFNFPPATIFLGDAGSMLIGLVVGTVAVQVYVKTAAGVALAVPAAVCAIPLLDSAAAILRRKLTGRSLFAADRGHFHHSLLVRGWTAPQAVLFIGLVCATTCVAAFMSLYFRNDFIAVVTVLAVIAFLIWTKTFGHIEFALIKDTVQRSARHQSRTHESRIQLQGSREWDKLWAAIVESADTYRLHRIKLTISIPSLHEAFFASWECPSELRRESDKAWRVVCPLSVRGIDVGQIEVHGAPSQSGALTHIVEVCDFLEPIEEDIRHVMDHIRHEHDTDDAAATTATVQLDDSAPDGSRDDIANQIVGR